MQVAARFANGKENPHPCLSSDKLAKPIFSTRKIAIMSNLFVHKQTNHPVIWQRYVRFRGTCRDFTALVTAFFVQLIPINGQEDAKLFSRTILVVIPGDQRYGKKKARDTFASSRQPNQIVGDGTETTSLVQLESRVAGSYRSESTTVFSQIPFRNDPH
jgi:hypothetical protein